MDSLMTAAARALAAGDPLGALKRVALRDDAPALPVRKSIDILPGSRVQLAPARRQQLSVMGHFADGSVRDVTRLTVFSNSDSAVADVNSSGLVEFKQGANVMFFVWHARRFFADLSIPTKKSREGKVHYMIRHYKERKRRTASAGIWPA